MLGPLRFPPGLAPGVPSPRLCASHAARVSHQAESLKLRIPACASTVCLSGLRRWLQAPVRKGVGSNPTAVTQAELALETPKACVRVAPELTPPLSAVSHQRKSPDHR